MFKAQLAAALACAALLAACGGGGNSPATLSSLAPVAVADSATVEEKAGTVWTQVATEGQTFVLAGTASVRYGAAGKFVTKTRTGSVDCSGATFGDPIFGTVKACSVPLGTAIVTNPPPTPTAPTPGPAPDGTYTTIAAEGEMFAVASGTVVWYGAQTSWLSLASSGSGRCSNDFFGADPLAGVAKSCQVAATAPPVVTPPPVVAPPVVVPPVATALPGDVVDSTGAVVPAAYRAMAAQLSTDAGIAYRYGPATPDIAGLPMVQAATDMPFPAAAGLGIPATYQLGAYSTDPGDPQPPVQDSLHFPPSRG